MMDMREQLARDLLNASYAELSSQKKSVIDLIADQKPSGVGPLAKIDERDGWAKLADKVAQAEGLTEDSAREQASAGLDALTPEEYARFHALNRAYRARFGFPFIICVRLHTKAGILAAMQARLNHEPETEFEAALAQVGLIVLLAATCGLAQRSLYDHVAVVAKELGMSERTLQRRTGGTSSVTTLRRFSKKHTVGTSRPWLRGSRP